MRILSLLIIISGLTAGSYAQDSTFKRKVIYAELGGNGFFTSINYETQFNNKPGLGFRIGIGYFYEGDSHLVIPFGANYLFKLRNEKSFIDVGFGATWGHVLGEKKEYMFSISSGPLNFFPSVGYRRHTSKNLMWRISLTPMINKEYVLPWMGFSIGKRF